MKKTISKALALILSLVILITATPIFADMQTSSLLTNSANGTNWMSYIDNSTKLTEITMPGSHDSGAKNIASGITSAWAKTQSLSITEQLNVGVRFLDMRLEYDEGVDGNIRIVHSSIDLNSDRGGALTLKECINDTYNFLNSHPTETVIMCMKEDDGKNESKLVSQINEFISSNPDKWYVSSSAPTLDQARGKIVLASRILTLRGIYFGWGDQGSDGGYVYETYKKLYIQDRYNMGTSNKWNNAVQPLLDLDKPDGCWIINFLSTTGGNINGVSSNANIMNQMFNDYATRNNKCYGVIMFDYVSDGLCKKTYKCNDLVAKTQPDPTQGQYYYRLNWNTTREVGNGWSGVYCKIYYRTNNGTGTLNSKTIFDNSDEYNGYQYVCNAENWDFSGYLSGYPVYVEFYYDFGYGAKTLAINQRLFVGKSPSSDLKLVASNDFVNSSSNSTSCKGKEQYYTNLTPQASTVEFTDPSDVYINLSSGGSQTVSFSGTIRDQYGVNWYDNTLSYSIDKSSSGVSLNGNTLTVNNAESQIINVTAKYSTTSGTIESPAKKIILTNNKLVYSYKNYDGTILQQGYVTNGTVPAYTNSTPTKPFNDTHHYTFNRFDETYSDEYSKTFFATFNEEEHFVYNSEVTKEPTTTADGVRSNQCSCGYSWEETIERIRFNSDESALIAALAQAQSIPYGDYLDTSFEELQSAINTYNDYLGVGYDQYTIDNATIAVLNAIYNLKPFLNIDIDSEYGEPSIKIDDVAVQTKHNSVLFATGITVSVTKDKTHKFIGWFDTVSNRYMSKDLTYTFKATTNVNLVAKFNSSTQATLTFVNRSGWVKQAITKTVDEWASMNTLAGILPEVPFSYGQINGRWVYDDASVLSKLSNGENVDISPAYTSVGFDVPQIADKTDDKPSLCLAYDYNSGEQTASFIMATNIPNGVKVESIGVAFYHAAPEDFDPTDNYTLLLNNRNLVSSFNPESITDKCIVNIRNYTGSQNIAARGYATYYDTNGDLQTVYSNQINIVGTTQQ